MTATTKDRWVKRWEVPKSSGDGNWIVAIDKDGNYGCSCPVWKFKRQECHHILEIKQNGGQEVAPLTPEQRAELRLKAYAKEGYRYHIWYNDPLHSWERQSIELLRHDPGIDDVKTFLCAESHRIVVIKENELAYERKFGWFVDFLKKCNLKDKWIKNPFYEPLYWLSTDGNPKYAPRITQAQLRQFLKEKWFDLTQYIIYNKTGVINPNLPKGSVYNSGEWGKRITGLEKHFKFLR